MRAVFIFLLLCMFGCVNFESASSVINDVYHSTADDLEARPLEYYSDYFSFIGEDQQGFVAFAIDVNRGRDGDKYQAEHFVVLHDEHKGWIDTVGSGPFALEATDIFSISNSENFIFHGQPADGITLTSVTNALTLTIEPIAAVYSRQRGLAQVLMGSAKATMQWQGREINGRVIYEYLYLPAFNRLTRNYRGLWADFHGIYVKVDDEQDLYIHTQRSPLLTPLVGEKAGFILLQNGRGELENIEMKVTKSVQAIGLYRWPLAWIGKFDFKQKTYELELKLDDRTTMVNWILGGFSMGVVKGRLRQGKSSYSLLGIGELLI